MLDRVFRVLAARSSVMAIVSGGIAEVRCRVVTTRTLRSPANLATLLTAPFANCRTQLPVFALLM
jgi:Fe2+ transport system protein B